MKTSLLSMYRLRTALLISFIGLTLFSGLTITLLSLRLSYKSRVNYTQEVGHLLTQAVTLKVENFLQEAEDVVEVTDRFSFKIKNGKVDYSLILNNLAHSLIVNHNLGIAIYTEEKTGYSLRLSLDEKSGLKHEKYGPSRFSQSSNYSEKDVIVQELIPNSSGTFTLKTYSYPDFPHKPLSVDENGGYDNRKRPFYVQGKAQPVLKKGEWTNCFTFMKNFKEIRTGLFYSTGLGDDKGEFFGVWQWVSVPNGSVGILMKQCKKYIKEE